MKGRAKTPPVRDASTRATSPGVPSATICCNTPSSRAVSATCSPVERCASPFASLIRWASPPDSVVADWPNRR